MKKGVMNCQNFNSMFTAKFIQNFYFDGEKLQAIGGHGILTRVFAQQGDLDGSCVIYSLMMMLIFHKMLDWDDLIDNADAKGNPFVYRIQGQFLYNLKGICRGGHILNEVSDKLNRCYGKKISEVFTTRTGLSNSISRRELHLRIRAQLDARKPVLIAFSRTSEIGHAVVAVGYRREAWNKLRLFCLDPARRLLFMQVWNNIIDLDYLSNDNDAITDIDHYSGKKVYVNEILIINEKSTELDCPF